MELETQTILDQATQAVQTGDKLRAHLLYVRATELEAKSIAGWIGRAQTARDIDEAIRSWATAVALDPRDSTTLSALRYCIRQKLATHQADAAPGLVSLAKVVAEAGHKSDAYTLARRATELEPKYEEGWIWRGGLADDPEEMTLCLKEALALNPADQRATAGLEWSRSHQPRKPAGADSASERSAKAIVDGQAALKQGDKARAQELFQQATELDEKNELAWLWRASTTSDTEQALDYVERALALNPNNESARQAQSWLRVKKLRANTVDSTSTPATPFPVPSSTLGTPPRPKRNRAARIIPLLFLVIALAVVVVALLYSRGFLP